MKAEIYVWSRVGHTPITKRGGSYCDELVKETTEVTSPADAREYVKGLIRRTPHADKGYFNIPDWPNQNTRSAWI